MKPRVKCGLINLLLLIFFTLIFLIFLSLSLITPDYDSSHDPPINGICIGDQIPKIGARLEECINPTCLEGYYVDAGICVEPTQYSFLSIYYNVFYVNAGVSGIFLIFFGFLELVYFIVMQPFNYKYHLERDSQEQLIYVRQRAERERERILTEMAVMAIVELSFFMERIDRESLIVLIYEIKNTFEFVRQCEGYLEIEIPPPYISPPSTPNMLVLAELARDELSFFLETNKRESLRVLFYKMENTNEFVRQCEGYLENPPPYISPEQ
jgi:hypothetical protein